MRRAKKRNILNEFLMAFGETIYINISFLFCLYPCRVDCRSIIQKKERNEKNIVLRYKEINIKTLYAIRICHCRCRCTQIRNIYSTKHNLLATFRVESCKLIHLNRTFSEYNSFVGQNLKTIRNDQNIMA